MKGAIRLESGDDNLMSILDTAAAVTQTAGTFSLLDTLEIITAMSPVTTQITDYNHALDTKKADFQKIGRATFVLADLEILNIKWTNFLSEMVAQAPIGEAAALQTIQNTITASYDHAIKVYSDAA
ncbi:hypothetical protein LI328DRAFT_133513 [Trichoderma asperelloides]|nr:hypothetical protein LI328DRAFT_133513 [Trichoderma asperelloides]